MFTDSTLVNKLFFSIAFSEHSAKPHLAHIQQNLQSGLSPDVFSEQGQTPLTAAILGGMSSPKAVKILLEHGANPSLRDQNGFTPWAAMRSRLADVVVAERMEKIKHLLELYQADQSDDIFFILVEAVQQGDLHQVQQLLTQGVDPNHPLIDPLALAVSNENIEMVVLLLSYQANMERGRQGYTVLMQAAEKGNLELIKILVQAGAKVEAFAWNDPRCRADWLAEQRGHRDAAAWLRQQLPPALQTAIVQKTANHDPKYAELYEKNTNGINCDLQTEDIVQVLMDWDARFTITITEVEADALTVIFENLPELEDLPAFVQEIYAFCPDVIDQHFGCFNDLVNSGQPLDLEIQVLIAGVDFSQENFAEVLLMRALQDTKTLRLWWD